MDAALVAWDCDGPCTFLCDAESKTVDARDKRDKAGMTASIKYFGRFAGDWATALPRPLDAA
jgi:hypothetical protein